MTANTTKKCGNCADYVVLEAEIKNLKEEIDGLKLELEEIDRLKLGLADYFELEAEIDRLELELANWKQQSL